MEEIFLLEVGRRIKQKRIERRMTIQELAQKSSISKGLVSQVENGKTVPSLPVMLGIIQSLDIEVSEFFQGLNLLEPTIFVNRKADYTSLEDGESEGLTYNRIMMRNLPASTIDFALINVSQQPCEQQSTIDAYEFVYVVKGSMHYHINSQMIFLEEGDSLFFDGRLPHSQQNDSSASCTLLVLYFFDQRA